MENGKPDLIERSAVFELLNAAANDEKVRLEASADIRSGRSVRLRAEGALKMIAKIRLSIGNKVMMPAADVPDSRVYSYARFEDHYRLVPCDEDVTCMACGYKRPRLRGEKVFFCNLCGACIGGLSEQ